MDVDAELTQQATPTIPSSSTTQASQLNAELTLRANTATIIGPDNPTCYQLL